MVHLFGGGLPSAVIDIIGSFYVEEFNPEVHQEPSDLFEILSNLVEKREKELLAEESRGGSTVKPADRKFYKKSNEVKQVSRRELKEELMEEAQSSGKP